MSEISPLAFVHPKAELGADVRVGPFAYVDAGVALGDGCIVHPHATLLGPATFGARNEFLPHCCLGAAPQDLKFKGGPTSLAVGDHNTFRENVTVHRGTEVDRQSGGVTRIGHHNLIMVGVHVAHDAAIDNHCIIANNVLIAGHLHIEDGVNIAGAAAIQHFVTVGRYSFITGMTRITRDVPPYTIAHGFDGLVQAMNVKGMQRFGIPDASIAAIEEVGRRLFPRRESGRALNMADAIAEAEGTPLAADPHVRYLLNFLRRQREVGRHGRYRESLRADRPEDRDGYYAAARGGATS